MSICIDHIPNETLSIILSFLDPLESLWYRQVSKRWRQRLVGYASITCRLPSHNRLYPTTTLIDGIVVKGYINLDNENSTNKKEFQRNPYESCRARGQLPEPRVLTSQNSSWTEKTLQVCTRGNTIAFRLDEHGNHLVWDIVNLSTSFCKMTYDSTLPPLPGNRELKWRLQKEPRFTRILLRADFSGIYNVKRLILRGCLHLQVLHLPSGLEGLDVSSCSSLTDLVFPPTQTRKLEALNLRGCRSLKAQDRTRLFGAATADIMRHVKELNVSETKRLDTFVLADAIRMVCQLVSLSLRYVATEPVIKALADSEASKTTLRFLDGSHSVDLNDEACEKLVNASIYLEVFNLRACRSVSTALYNSVPIWLQRSPRDNLSGLFTVDSSSTRSSRKGDVMFELTKK